jgi:hypothetical protein
VMKDAANTQPSDSERSSELNAQVKAASQVEQ